MPWEAIYPGLGLAWVVVASIGIRVLALDYSGTPYHQRVIWAGVAILVAVPVSVHFIRGSHGQAPDDFD